MSENVDPRFVPGPTYKRMTIALANRGVLGDHEDPLSIASSVDAEIAALRAECARNARALKVAMEALGLAAEKRDSAAAAICAEAIPDITKILSEP